MQFEADNTFGWDWMKRTNKEKMTLRQLPRKGFLVDRELFLE
jgi:hypothetical protein